MKATFTAGIKARISTGFDEKLKKNVKILKINNYDGRSEAEFMEFATPSGIERFKRSIDVDTTKYPITTDQNANPWLNGVEYEVVLVEGETFPADMPEILVELFNEVEKQ